MTDVPVFEAGGYRYIKAVFQYSGGVAAEPGWEIERARFDKPLPLADAFAAAAGHLNSLGRPNTAFAACELRSPAQFTEQGFYDFNKAYVATLERWGIYQGGDDPVNAVARTNVVPMYGQPAQPVMDAFSYTVQDIGHLVGEEIAARGACAGGLVWHYARPPVIGLEYEMDVRGATREMVI